MTKHASSTSILSTHLSQPLEVGDPDIVDGLAVFPLFGPEPGFEYVSFATGREHGVAIKELESAASVNDLFVQNPTDNAVLLYDGQEVLGAQQNRTFDVTVLVARHSKARIPVSCVEAGRWDFSRHTEDFQPAPQAAYPDLRRTKNRQVRERVAAGLDARATQSEVWHEIDRKASRHGAQSKTGAMHDVYETRRDRLNKLTSSVKRREGQVGSLVAIGGKFTVLDHVSRAEVFASLHGPLVQGYALDALEVSDAPAPSIDEACGFVSLVSGIQHDERDAIGLGRQIHFSADGVGGSGLVCDGELIQLSAFPAGSDGR